jgi:DNA-binding LacI/PurR family transcriptional regulator
MAGQILVPLKRQDRAEEFLPYLEALASPGTKVVFLTRNSIDSWHELQDHWITAESAREAMAAGEKLIGKYSWEAQKEWAEHKFSGARQALQDRGVDVAVEIYRGALREAIENCMTRGEVRLIVMRGGIKSRLLEMFRGMIPLLGSLNRSGFSPVMLLRPRRMVA